MENAPARPGLRSLLKRSIDGIGTENAVWLTVVAFILGVLGYLGWSFLPSNADSLVYHLARVAHWIQDQSVGPFAAHYTAQIELSPLAEFNLAHFHLLVGSDRLDAYVQLFVCIICLVAVSEIARLLNGSRWTQVVAVVICATVPSGILAATSTENDYFAANNRHRSARHRPGLAICRLVVVSGLVAGIGHWSQLLGQGHGDFPHRSGRRPRPPRPHSPDGAHTRPVQDHQTMGRRPRRARCSRCHHCRSVRGSERLRLRQLFRPRDEKHHQHQSHTVGGGREHRTKYSRELHDRQREERDRDRHKRDRSERAAPAVQPIPRQSR